MKNVLITGGSRGIGKELVCIFCEHGYSVAFTYKNSIESARELEEKYGAFAIRCDLESESEIISCITHVKEYFGGEIDILINNAAISEIKMFSDITTDDWKRMMDVNLTAPYLFCREVIADMIHKKEGRIINVSSMWGQVGASCEVHYSAAKSGLIGLTKALAKELGPSNITVNAVAPGVIDTDMNARLTKGELEMLRDEIPLMKLGTTRDVAELVYFLCSDAAGYITGQVIATNGGMII